MGRKPDTQQQISRIHTTGRVHWVHPQLVQTADVWQKNPKIGGQINGCRGDQALSVYVNFPRKHQPGAQIVQCVHRIQIQILFDIQGIVQGDLIQHLHIRRAVFLRQFKPFQRSQTVLQLQLQRVLEISIPLIPQRGGKTNDRGLTNTGDRCQVKGTHERSLVAMLCHKVCQQMLTFCKAACLFSDRLIDPFHWITSFFFSGVTCVRRNYRDFR